MITSTGSVRAVNYRRVSSTEQARPEHNSLETQREKFLAYCQRLDRAAVGEFEDHRSGARADRDEYQAMLDLLRSGGADEVVVERLDRFGRDDEEILLRYVELKRLGVQIVATDQGLDDPMMFLIHAGIASHERQLIRERVRSNMRRAAEKGAKSGRAPYGLQRVYQGKEFTWEIEPDEAKVVREMYRLAVDENLGYKAISDRLNSQGHRGRQGRPFGSDTVRKILTNEAISGTYVWGKKPRKGSPPVEKVIHEEFFPAILSQEEWDTLQARLLIRRQASRGSTHKSDYLLSGIARCGTCGGPMVGKAGYKRKDGTRYRNYWCSRAQKSRDACATYNGHSAPKLEAAVLEYLARFSDPKLVRKHIATAGKQVTDARQAELNKVEKALVEIANDFITNMDLFKRGTLNEEELRLANEQRRAQKETLEVRKVELTDWLSRESDRENAAETLPVAIGSFMDTIATLDVRQQKAELQGILSAAHVHRDGTIELEFRT